MTLNPLPDVHHSPYLPGWTPDGEYVVPRLPLADRDAVRDPDWIRARLLEIQKRAHRSGAIERKRYPKLNLGESVELGVLRYFMDRLAKQMQVWGPEGDEFAEWLATHTPIPHWQRAESTDFLGFASDPATAEQAMATLNLTEDKPTAFHRWWVGVVDGWTVAVLVPA